MNHKRPSFVNFPIPFDHPYTIPTLVMTVGASALLYYSLQAQHEQDLKEAIRLRVISKRKHCKRQEDKFASLKIEKQFVNPFSEWTWPTLSWKDSFLYWLGINNNNQLPKIEQDLVASLPMFKPDIDQIKHTQKTSFTWLGQSTCLFSLEGLRILTDPIFEHKDRLRPPPCQLEELKGCVDIILISHHHFDHLDEKTALQFGNEVTWYIPLGLREWFVKRGIDNVIELDWFQELHHKGRPDILIACVPAMHSSGHAFEKDESLWCSFVIKSKSDRLFFCGDTGYVPELFDAIRDLYAPFTLAALPIGTFEPRRLLKSNHMNPEEAVKAHHHLGSPFTVGIHWGTFMKSNEPYLLPRQQVAHLSKEGQFITTAFGKTLFIQE
ncbi:beta-lactamase superfamily domain-containing protein [Gilbertella persicaria]|uniref:beta-lactamase superfamily domain-containing protein n=1 Tax=Gilbertella persicaria TaxID=101096 RepID=UPI00221FE4A7|nr:beta-lactamase superfamily domain-containing protein [Gilbertella persicaria]KAI8057554.1 beta-lactamase superfamily domain-containing protein [Gilbertella persicaria]